MKLRELAMQTKEIVGLVYSPLYVDVEQLCNACLDLLETVEAYATENRCSNCRECCVCGNDNSGEEARECLRRLAEGK